MPLQVGFMLGEDSLSGSFCRGHFMQAGVVVTLGMDERTMNEWQRLCSFFGKFT